MIACVGTGLALALVVTVTVLAQPSEAAAEEGKPVGTVLHVDRAQFENEDTGGYLMMKQPSGGFPLGNYRVEIHYEAITDMSLLTLVRFKVVPATGAAGPKP